MSNISDKKIKDFIVDDAIEKLFFNPLVPDVL